MIRIEAGDALEVIPRLVAEGVVVDSICTDPPYHLQARTKRFGLPDAAPPQFGKDGAMGRLSKGFMGKQWDGGDVAFRPETWRTVGTILRPGGFLVVFGGTRTYHRMTCAIEDAGFVIQDCLMWLYGTGFPKRRDMLKPAYEPIVLAYKPGGDRTMQIDECRIGYTSEADKRLNTRGVHSGGSYSGLATGKAFARSICPVAPANDAGRWPANICHDGSDEVITEFPYSKSGAMKHEVPAYPGQSITGFLRGRSGPSNQHGGEGSAARFFWSPKANKKDRAGSNHPTVKPISLLDWLVPLVTPIGGMVLDPFAGSGTTGSAAINSGREAVLIEREDEYLSDIHRRFYGTIEEAAADLTEALRSWL